MAEFKYAENHEPPYVGRDQHKKDMKVSKSAKHAQDVQELLEPTEIPLSTNTVKKPLKVNIFRTAWRLFMITGAMGVYAIGYVINFIVHPRKEKRMEHNAQLFAGMFRALGGAFTKIGQQLSLRQDIFSPAFCKELKELQDNAKPFAFAYTKKVLEDRTQSKLEDLFQEFDENPIGKASIACVYRAVLWSGDVVAVKVKRPRIEKVFSADISALSLLLQVLEFLTLLKSGISYNLRQEIKEMFTEELNFNIEKRYQELFREFMLEKQNKRFNVTAPRIYFGLSSDKIIVSEFLEGGIFMSSYMKLSKEEKARKLAELNIDAKKVAKRLIQLNHFSFYELPFFHGDPHPGNVYLRANNKIVLVDFGSCGTFGEKERNLMKLMQYYYTQRDVSGMTQSVVSLMEPLPPIDVHAFTKELEVEWWHGYYGIISKHAHWTEKTSFRLWSALFRISRKHNVPMPLHMLRMVRATLAYDTVAAELYPQLDVFKEYQVYFKRYAQKVEAEMKEDFLRQLFFGPDAINFVRLKQIFNLGQEAIFRMQQLVRMPVPNINSLTDKVFDFIRLGINYLMQILAIGGLGALAAYIYIQPPQDVSFYEMLESTATVFDPNQLLEDPNSASELTTVGKGSIKGLDDHEIPVFFDIIRGTVILMGIFTFLFLKKALSRFKDVDSRT